MTKVYCLFSGSWEDRGLDAVFANLDDAMAYDHGHTPKWAPRGEDRWRCEWSLVRHRAKAPITYTLENQRVPVIDGVAVLPDGREVRPPAGVEHVIVPIPPPPDVLRGPIVDWTDTCDYDIEAHDLL